MRKKIKYQGGITKLVCQKKAAWNKSLFRKAFLNKEVIPSYNSSEVNFEITSFSGAAAFEDQLLSILSFIMYAGTPIKWTIYSDKTYTNEQKDIFRKLFPFVAVEDWDVFTDLDARKVFQDFKKVNVMAKKLNILLCHPYQNQTIFLDSDIVFYKNISLYLNSPLLSKGLWYVPDALGAVDKYFSVKRASIYPLNAGLLILNKDLDAEDVWHYMESLNGKFSYFTEQEAFEYALIKQGAQTLDPRQFIIDTSDQFDFSVKYYPDTIAMRHYTGPVRHKMWQMGWKWHLSAVGEG